LEDEVPEIYHGMVEIRSIAREPGYRSKVAVAALQPGIDPVGACVGIRGVRIQAIVRELHDEKIDVIEWNPDPAAFIAKALSPARVNGVYLDETKETKTATVVVPEDQLSLAIGRDGQNARLAAKLTAWRIDIKSLPEATSEALYKLQETPEMAQEAEKMTDMIQQVESILARKQEGRPITPEEYQVLGRFVNTVETGVEDQRQAELEAQRAKETEARALIPDAAFDMPLDDLPISPRFIIILTGEGYSTVGELMMQLELDSDAILAINGLGPKTMEDIRKSLDEIEFPEPEEEEPVVEAEAEAEAEEETEIPVAVEEVTEEIEPVMDVEEAEPVEEVEEPVVEDPVMFEQAIAQSDITFIDDDEEEDDLQRLDKDREKGTKKKKYRQVEYDPDLDVTIVRRRRKRDSDDWDDENWEEFLD
jgi:N utilization substance protein A